MFRFHELEIQYISQTSYNENSQLVLKICFDNMLLKVYVYFIFVSIFYFRENIL